MSKSCVLNSFKGLSAAVSGGSSGLGLATVLRLADKGCKVAVCDLKEPATELPNNCYFVKTDISDYANVEATMVTIKKESTKLDILVNCAGIGFAQKIYNSTKKRPHDKDNFDSVIKTNLLGTFYMMSTACGLFALNEPNLNQQRGVIINTASIAAFEGQAGQCAYSASKAAIAGMTLPAARDLMNMGVRVVSIAPGLFDTPLLQGLSEKMRQGLSVIIPFPKRLGDPDEYAHLVQAIIENPLLNGEVIRLDGALRMLPG